MFKKIIEILLILALLLLTACSGLANKPEQFKVNITNIKILDSTLLEQRYQVTLRVMNRSQTAYQIDGMSFDIELNGKDFASGVTNEKINIDPLSEGLITVNVSGTLFGILRQMSLLQEDNSQSFNYEISGHVFSGNDLFGIPFSEQGEIHKN